MLKIYNTLTKSKELFVPRVAGKVGLYVCGMTVYDYCHIGHARVLVVFDVVARYLRYCGKQLTYVRNITDIDDKIISRANASNSDFLTLTQHFSQAMHEDQQALGVLPPDLEPKASESMADIIAMVEVLIGKGLAYVGSNGDVFYAVAKFPDYGKLSGKNTADLRAGERVGINTAKRDPLDFVLWKMAKSGEPSWNSPWGKGRPGWHIECSAMATACLGEHFDIHGGGSDLQFPHHENEIAQSQGASGKKFVNYWMHNGFVRIDQEKMSKSLGNFFTVREVLGKFQPEVIRFFIITSHYRSPLNYADAHLAEARLGLTRLYTALRGVAPHSEVIGDYTERFASAMDDDFNTPIAVCVLFDIARQLNVSRASGKDDAPILANTLKTLAAVLGLLQDDPDTFLQNATTGEITAANIDQQIQVRNQAKRNKNWQQADTIRDQLKASGIILEDVAGGKTIWRRG